MSDNEFDDNSYESPGQFEPMKEDQQGDEEVLEEKYLDFSKRQVSPGERRSVRSLWLISYSDFMTILMIFFLAMYGYAVLARASLQKMQKHSRDNFEEITKSLKEKMGEQVKVEDLVDKLIIQFQEKILFPSGQATLSENSRRTLDDLANSLKLVDGEIIVEGHTDNVPIKSKRFKSNWELSAARAFQVVETLSNDGINEKRLAAWGFGETRPIASNLDDPGRAINRRIEVVVLKKVKK